ncbi:family 78 glycoside hydrolase catalytic domain [Cryptosporangium aurantiacum]|nr:family 78 glycoside hydrolase catalytic domain [Cryptosporangium aurantiacum]
MTAPYDLRIDSGGDEFPVSGANPRLSWKLPAGWVAQEAYELETSDGARIAATTSRHLYVEWPWAPLESGQAVRWRVRVTGLGGTSAWSEWAAFEVGLLDADWSSRWISPAEDPQAGPRPASTLATTFRARGPVSHARLYATALGVYEAFVNGIRAGTAELSPGSTSYASTLYAQAADVTGAVNAGENRLEVVLSDGWFRGLTGAFREPATWGVRTAARVELHLRYTDGGTEVVRSGPGWTSSTGTIVRADLMDGQTTDFTAVPSSAVPVLVDAVTAPPIDWSPAPPVRRIAQRPAETVRRLDNGAYVVDFGQNASGWITLSDLGPAGTRTVIDHGEHVDASGDLTTAHLDAQRGPDEPPTAFVQRDDVVSDGAPDRVFEPRHTVHGFRYARVTRDVPLRAADVTMQIVHTDLRRTATFTCSDDDLNRLHEAAEWSFRGNAVDVPTDCPTRERSAWTGDYQVFVPTAARLYDVAGFSRKWLRSVRDDQFDDGRICNISPDAKQLKVNHEPLSDLLTGSAGWGDAIVHVPWVIYETYGDRQVLAENWDAMVRWVEFALNSARTARHSSRVQRSAEPQEHEAFLWDGGFHWGEWLEPRTRAADGTLAAPVWEDPAGWFGADKGEVATAYLYRSTRTLAAVAALLDRPEDSARYGAVAERVRDAWRREFLDADGRTTGDTQAGYVRALAFGLVPDQLRDRVAQHLVDLVRAAGMHLGTGFLSTADLLPVLADTGHADVAYAVLRQRTSPSWLGMLDRGATTIWEDWDGVDEHGTATASLNHYSKGAVVSFLHTHTLGLRQAPGSVAWESFVVAPVPDAALRWARGTFDSPQGRISVAWQLDGEDFVLDVEVPAGSTATVVFPDGHTVRTGPGRFAERRPALLRQS